jgi:hypothetical protein
MSKTQQRYRERLPNKGVVWMKADIIRQSVWRGARHLDPSLGSVSLG